jgi:hypothetical protein
VNDLDPPHLGGREPTAVVRAYADAPDRLVGYLVDAVALTALSFLGAIGLSLVFGPVVSIDAGGASQVTVDRGLAVANAILGTVISLVYFVASWRGLGGSPGQRLCNMRVEGVDGRVPLARWVLRWTFLGIPVAIVGVASAVAPGWVVLTTTLVAAFWFLILLLSIARSSTRRGWLDRAGGTVVTKPVLPAPVDLPHDGTEARVH